MSGGGIKLEGLDEFKWRLNNIVKRVTRAAIVGGYHGFAIDVMTDAVENAPKDLGDLRGSGYVSKPFMEGGAWVIEAGFGGPAEAYAVVQETNENYRHEVGGAHYFERALTDNEGNVADAIRKQVEKVMKGGRVPRLVTLQPQTPNEGPDSGGGNG